MWIENEGKNQERRKKRREREREIKIAKEEICSFLQIRYFGFEDSQFCTEEFTKQKAWHLGLCTDTATFVLIPSKKSGNKQMKNK